MARCTAPKRGHGDAATARLCPACRNNPALIASLPERPTPLSILPLTRRLELARASGTQTGTLARLARDPAPYVRAAVAAHPNIDDDTYNYLATTTSLQVRTVLAARPDLTPERAERFARHKDPNVRAVAASAPTAPQPVLRHLWHTDRDPDVRAAVLANAAAPDDIIFAAMARDTPFTNRALAQNPALSESHVRTLYAHDHFGTLAALAQNPATPIDILIAMAGHRERGVRVLTADNPRLPADTLAHLIIHSCEPTRQAALKNPSTPDHVITHAAREGDYYILMDIARLDRIPLPALAVLCDDEDPDVHRRARSRVREMLAKNLDIDPTNERALTRLGELHWAELTPDSVIVKATKRTYPD